MNELILLTDFWEQPSIGNYLNCKDYFYKSKSFDPFEKYIEKVLLEIENRNFDSVINEFKETRQLSLFYLDKISKCYKLLNQPEKSVKYFTRAQEVAQVILSTGTGSRTKPYQIIYPTDSKELLQYLNENCIKQAIIDFEGKKLETLICKSGNEYYFDVTDIMVCKENAVEEKINDVIKWFEKNSNRPV